jgi:acetoin utilization deacetylase AcuC-like enzyme
MTGLLHDPEFFARHNDAQHVENAGRLAQLPAIAPVASVRCRAATDAELLAVHAPDHLERIAATCVAGGGSLDPDTYCCAASDEVARAAAGGLVDLCDAVHRQAYANGMALIRPPGHHATADRAMGFCLYNHVAVAAAALRCQGVPRVAIVDFDVHHGNGTQDIFYADPTVLYLSSHQYPHYPGTGAANETGQGPGVGFTLNCPLAAGAGDDEFLAAYRECLLPALVAFAPGFILVSAGYDAHAADPLAGLQVTTAGYATLVDLLIQAAEVLCDGKIVFSLEGGYNPEALAECLSATARALIASHS